MAITQLCGFELGRTTAPPNTSNNVVVDSIQSGTPATTVDAVRPRSGLYAFHANVTSDFVWLEFYQVLSDNSNPAIYLSCRFYAYFVTLPTSNSYIWQLSETLPPGVRANTDGSVTQQDGGATQTTGAAGVIQTGTWQLWEIDFNYTSGAGMRVFVGGTLACSRDAAPTASANSFTRIGVGVNSAPTTCEVFFDDVVWYDSTIGNDLGVDYSIDLLKPISDSQVSPTNAWLGGAGGTTNLWNAVDNVNPPRGLGSGFLNTTQIKCSSATNPAFYEATCAAYNTVIGANTILAVQPVIHNSAVTIEGAGVNTGDVWITGNPTQTQPALAAIGSFEFGGGPTTGVAITTTTAAGISSWIPTSGVVTSAPVVTVAVQPTVRVDKTNGLTDASHVDFIGIYVMHNFTLLTRNMPISRGGH
jgi:hypothetical protein